MDNDEKELINIINEKSSFEPDFKKIENKIILEKKQSFLFINILLGAESLVFIYCAFMTLKIALIPQGEGQIEKNNILYLLLLLSFMFTIIITLIIKGLMKKNFKKGGGIK